MWVLFDNKFDINIFRLTSLMIQFKKSCAETIEKYKLTYNSVIIMF